MPLSSELTALLNSQIHHELTNFLSYEAVADSFKIQGYQGLAAWARQQAQEELEHYGIVLSILLDFEVCPDRGTGLPAANIVKQLAGEGDHVNPVHAAEWALEVEKGTTTKINKILDVATKEGHHGVYHRVAPLAANQIEEEHEIRVLVRILKGLLEKDPGALYTFYPKNLGK